MHSARIDHSDRLQRVYNLLRKGGEYSTMDIIHGAQVCAVNSIISELRANGKNITCQRRGHIWWYRLTK